MVNLYNLFDLYKLIKVLKKLNVNMNEIMIPIKELMSSGVGFIIISFMLYIMYKNRDIFIDSFFDSLLILQASKVDNRSGIFSIVNIFIKFISMIFFVDKLLFVLLFLFINRIIIGIRNIYNELFILGRKITGVSNKYFNLFFKSFKFFLVIFVFLYLLLIFNNIAIVIPIKYISLVGF
ncbi:MAG: hypothetical protein IJ475_02175 [Bacilli bacterium]|nr:hypothetical protein [Bacilli bacterium]